MMNLSGVLDPLVHGLALHAVRVPGALALWQVDSINSGNSKLLMMFVGIAALALSAQAIAFVLMAVGATRAQKRMTAIFEEVRTKALPVLEKSQGMLEELSPKFKDITENAQHISFVLRDKVDEFEPTLAGANVTLRDANETLRDANAKTRAQVARVDGMVTSMLNATAEIAGTIHHGIRGPVREVAGLVSGVRAGLDTLIGRMQHLRSGVASSRAVRVETAAPVTDMRDVEFAQVVADRHEPEE